MNALLALVRKELVETLRDRRALWSSLSCALAGPWVLFVVIMALARARDDVEPLAVSYCAGAAPLPGCLEAAVQLAIAVSARSDKEGQSYLTLFSLAPMVCAVFASVRDLPAAAAPWLWELTQLRLTLATGTLDIEGLTLAALGHAVIGVAALTLRVRRVGHERFLQAQ